MIRLVCILLVLFTWVAASSSVTGSQKKDRIGVPGELVAVDATGKVIGRVISVNWMPQNLGTPHNDSGPLINIGVALEIDKRLVILRTFNPLPFDPQRWLFLASIEGSSVPTGNYRDMLLFKQSDCQGEPYLRVSRYFSSPEEPILLAAVNAPGQTLYLPARSAQTEDIGFRSIGYSFLASGFAQCANQSDQATRAVKVEPTIDLEAEFTPPFHVETSKKK